MRVGSAVLETSQAESVCERATDMGAYMREELREYEMVKDIRGEGSFKGSFNGIAFRPPRSLSLRLVFSSFNRIHPAVFGQMLVTWLFRDHGIFAQICGNDCMVLKLARAMNV